MSVTSIKAHDVYASVCIRMRVCRDSTIAHNISSLMLSSSVRTDVPKTHEEVSHVTSGWYSPGPGLVAASACGINSFKLAPFPMWMSSAGGVMPAGICLWSNMCASNSRRADLILEQGLRALHILAKDTAWPHPRALVGR